MPLFNIVDTFFLVVVVLGLLRGLVRGLSRELADVFRFGGAVVATWYFYEPVGQWIYGNTGLSDRNAFLLGALAVLLGSFIALILLHLVLSHIMKLAFEKGIERVGGMLAGGMKGALLAAVVVLLAGLMPHEPIRRAVREESRAGGWIHAHWPGMLERLEERYPEAAALKDRIGMDAPPEDGDLYEPEEDPYPGVPDPVYREREQW